jgi:hypothetical protein
MRSIRRDIATPKRDAVLQELEAVAASSITDVLWWDNAGNVSVRPSEDLAGHVKAVTPTMHGNQIEIEMHDKMRALNTLAKHYGLMEVVQDENRPSIIGINLHGPAVTSYEVKEVIEEDDEEEVIGGIGTPILDLSAEDNQEQEEEVA